MVDITRTERLLLTPEFKEEDFKTEIFRNGHSLCVIAPTWYANDKKTMESFADDFKKDYYRAAADYGARPKAQSRRYFTAPEFVKSIAVKRPWPNNADGTFTDWFYGGGKTYFLGLDLSNLAHDNAGLCLVHVEETGMITVDLFHVIPGGRGEHLIFAEVRAYIRTLQMRGFSIVFASMDSWQSLSLTQDLNAMGISTEINSTDRTSQLPDTVSGLMLSGKVSYYYYPLFIKEATDLIKTKAGRIDHPSNSSKDCWDSFVHAVYMANMHGAGTLIFRTLR